MSISSLEELKTALSGHAQEADVLDFVVRSVETEKSTGIDRHRKANKEAEGLRKTLGSLKEKLSDLGYEDDGDLDEFFDTLKKSKTEAPESNKELKKLTKQLADLKTQLDQKTAAESELRDRSKKLRIKNQLGKDLSDKVYAHDYVIDGLINNKQIDIDEDGETVVWMDGDNRVPYDKGLKSFIEKNASLVKNQMKAGAQTTAAQGSSTPGKLTPEQLSAMSPAEVAANIAVVRESLGLKKQ